MKNFRRRKSGKRSFAKRGGKRRGRGKRLSSMIKVPRGGIRL